MTYRIQEVERLDARAMGWAPGRRVRQPRWVALVGHDVIAQGETREECEARARQVTGGDA